MRVEPCSTLVGMPDALDRLATIFTARAGRTDTRPRWDWLVLLASLISAGVALTNAWLAYGLREQLHDLRAQREGAARPYLIMRSALAIRGSNWLGITLENIGSGPALGVTVDGRLIEEPPEWPQVPRWYTNQMVRAAFASEEDRAHPFGDLHAIAAEHIGTVWFYGTWASSEDRAGIIYFLGAHVNYHDLFGNRIEAGRDGELWASITFPEE